MPDLLEEESVTDPITTSVQINMSTTEGLLRGILQSVRSAHPNQRAIVKLATGGTTFSNDISVLVEFYGHGNEKCKSHKTMISHGTDITLYVATDNPIQLNTTAINAFGPLPLGTPLYINEEIAHLYLYIHAAAPATYTVNNLDQAANPGSVIPIIHIEAWTNPEDTL